MTGRCSVQVISLKIKNKSAWNGISLNMPHVYHSNPKLASRFSLGHFMICLWTMCQLPLQKLKFVENQRLALSCPITDSEIKKKEKKERPYPIHQLPFKKKKNQLNFDIYVPH